MKKILFVIAFLLAVVWSQNRTTNVGSAPWYKMAFWGSDSSTKLLFLNDTVYNDSSGTLVNISAGADSCSDSISLFQGRNLEPIWKYEMDLLVKADSLDSTAVSYRIETRKRKHQKAGAQGTSSYWGKWIPYKRARGDANTTILDSVLTWPTALAKGTWAEESHLFFVTGAQIRLCPEHLDTTITTDSIWHDSIYIYLK